MPVGVKSSRPERWPVLEDPDHGAERGGEAEQVDDERLDRHERGCRTSGTAARTAPLGVQAHQGVGHGGPPRHMRARGASRPVFTPTFSPAFLLLSPNRIVPATPTPGRSPRRPPPAATRRGAGQIGIPVTQAGGWPAHGTKDALRRSPARSPHCPPNRDPMRARSPVRSPHRPPTPGGSPTVPAGVHLVVPRTRPRAARDGGRSPRRPPAHSGWQRRGRASGGRRRRA